MHNISHNVRGGVGKSPLWLEKKSRFLALSILFTAAISWSSFVFAQEFPQETNAVSSKSSKTEIIADDAAGTVRIVINGKTFGMFTEEGLHVIGDVVYGGTITDTGAEYIQKKIDAVNTDGGADEE